MSLLTKKVTNYTKLSSSQGSPMKNRFDGIKTCFLDMRKTLKGCQLPN